MLQDIYSPELNLWSGAILWVVIRVKRNVTLWVTGLLAGSSLHMNKFVLSVLKIHKDFFKKAYLWKNRWFWRIKFVFWHWLLFSNLLKHHENFGIRARILEVLFYEQCNRLMWTTVSIVWKNKDVYSICTDPVLLIRLETKRGILQSNIVWWSVSHTRIPSGILFRNSFRSSTWSNFMGFSSSKLLFIIHVIGNV